MRYLIYFSYDGSNFNGYQKQPNKRTVEGVFEEALQKINNKKTGIYASGRTDRGVHANRQSAHFDLNINITPYKLKRALNTFLPKDVHVIEAKVVDSKFNARFDVKKKTYKYIINCGEYYPPERNYVYQYSKNLDVNIMKEAIKHFVGEHDFSPFVSNESQKESYKRRIFSANISKQDSKVIITFVGNGFMKYQVRYMVGTLIKIGSNKLDVGIVKKILFNKEFAKHVSIVSPEGLYLENVEY